MRTVVGMATFGHRKEAARQAIESLSGQVDDIFLYDNDHGPDLTDNGKFWGLTQVQEPVYYFTCDDDIDYPKGYISRMKKMIDKYGCIVTYHGRNLMRKGVSYYTGGHKQYHFRGDIHSDIEVDVCGTGVTGFRTDFFNPVDLMNSEYKRMSDIIFSLEAARQGKRIMLLSHTSQYLKPIYIPEQYTIHATEKGKCFKQSELADMIYDLRRATKTRFSK